MSWQKWSKGNHTTPTTNPTLHTSPSNWYILIDGNQLCRHLEENNIKQLDITGLDQLVQQLNSFLQQVKIRKVSLPQQSNNLVACITSDPIYNKMVNIDKYCTSLRHPWREKRGNSKCYLFEMPEFIVIPFIYFWWQYIRGLMIISETGLS